MQSPHYQIATINFSLPFRHPAGTSRGTYLVRKGHYILITSPDDPTRWGIGECAPLPDLSIDAIPLYEYILGKACRYLERGGKLDTESLRSYPSILFGLETALQHFEKHNFAFWDTSFSKGEKGIPINGLIWMGDYHYMLEQIREKMEAGYRCIKLKIGAIDFEQELDLLRHIRKEFSAQDIELRVDANGAFSPQDALIKLERLAQWDIHSIEQPIRAGQWEEMARLTTSTPIPIALDEELIGGYSLDEKQRLLTTINPQYIILKPSLHGGLTGCKEWITEAERRDIGWWVTSALESNIGLNAIAQWTATWDNPLPQGLGTGQLFTENIDLPLSIRGDQLWYDPDKKVEHGDTEVRNLFFKTNNKFRTSVSRCSDFNSELDVFLAEWNNDRPDIKVQTSGSTGKPTELWVRKEFMRQSARTTCNYFQLKEGDKALLCMPLKYIAGKMMVVRTLVTGLDLIVQPPSGHPLKGELPPLDFAAMTPMQVYNSLQVPEEEERLKQIKILLIGGASLDTELEKKLSTFPNPVYLSYGMTETVSHIALRQINGEKASSYYTPFPSVKISLSEKGTLVIDAPLVSEEILITNDLAEILDDGSFRILGRIDNMINSGGIKIITEELEKELRTIISANFVVTSVPHPQLGEAVTLLIEGIDKEILFCTDNIPAYHRPRYVVYTENIPLTGNGKTDRVACKTLAEQLVKSLQ